MRRSGCILALALGCLVAGSAAAVAAGPSSLTPSTHRVGLAEPAGNCCANADVTFTNNKAYTVFVKDVSTTGSGWNYNFPSNACYPYTRLDPGQQCVVTVSLYPFNGTGRYPGTLTVEDSKSNDLSTLDGSTTVQLGGTGTAP